MKRYTLNLDIAFKGDVIYDVIKFSILNLIEKTGEF